MSAVEHDDTTDELSSIQDVLDQQARSRERKEASAPSGFDPAALFLLKMLPPNLFDPTGSPFLFRCKGCGDDRVRMNDRERHHKRHLAAWLRGEVKAKKEAAMSNEGPKARQLRERREEAARIQDEGAESVSLPEEEEGSTSKPARTSRARTGPEKPAGEKKRGAALRTTATGSRADSQAICDELVKRLSKDLKGVTTKANENVGYVSIKHNDKLIGYGWLTNKADLRVEAAIEPTDIDADVRVMKCNRSKDMAARARIEGNPAGYALAIKMLKAAAKKQAARA